MDYWKEKPAKLLLDERLTGMTPEELMAWFWLRQRARMQDPPGVLTADDRRLQEWSGLTRAQWKKARQRVLQFFVQDEGGVLHDKEIREEYRAFCLACHQNSVEQRRKANARWKKKDPDPRFVDPYENLPMPRHAVALPVHSSGIGKNGVSDSEIRVNAAACRGIAEECRGSPNRSTHKVDLGGDDAPPASSAAVAQPPPTPSLPSPETAAERERRVAAQKAMLSAQFQEIERQRAAADAAAAPDPQPAQENP